MLYWNRQQLRIYHMSTSGDESKMAQKSYSYTQSNLNLPIQGGHIAQRTLNVCVSVHV